MPREAGQNDRRHISVISGNPALVTGLGTQAGQPAAFENAQVKRISPPVAANGGDLLVPEWRAEGRDGVVRVPRRAVEELWRSGGRSLASTLTFAVSDQIEGRAFMVRRRRIRTYNVNESCERDPWCASLDGNGSRDVEAVPSSNVQGHFEVDGLARSEERGMHEDELKPRLVNATRCESNFGNLKRQAEAVSAAKGLSRWSLSSPARMCFKRLSSHWRRASSANKRPGGSIEVTASAASSKAPTISTGTVKNLVSEKVESRSRRMGARMKLCATKLPDVWGPPLMATYTHQKHSILIIAEDAKPELGERQYYPALWDNPELSTKIYEALWSPERRNIETSDLKTDPGPRGSAAQGSQRGECIIPECRCICCIQVMGTSIGEQRKAAAGVTNKTTGLIRRDTEQ
ncbi:hypothetical protein V8D89_012120 [Ganoderma adspersum]